MSPDSVLLVNVETGEIAPAPLDRAEAERITTRIRLRLDAIADNYVAVMPLIREAIERGAWVALGYNGVSQYVSECFGDALQHLGVEVRREVVRELSAAGLTTRAIAPVVGVSQKTVSRVIKASESHDSLAAPAAPTGEPYEEWRCEVCGGVDSEGDPEDCTCGEPDYDQIGRDAALEAQAVAAAQHQAQQRPLIGLNGKTYQRPQPAAPVQAEPAAPRRRPLADAFWTGVYEAEKRIESLHRLTQDDRWPQNAEKVAAKHRNDLHRINDLLQQVINSLPEKEATP